MQGFVRGLTLAVASMFLVVIVNIMQQNGIDIRSIAIALGALGLTYMRKIPVPVILVGAAIVGMWLY